MTVDLSKLLSNPVESAVAPPPIPEGHYYGQIKAYEFGESQEKKTPFVRFQVGPISPDNDVPTEQLANIDITKRNFRKDYFLTEDALFRLRNLIESCKIPIAGRSFDATIPELRNAQVKVEIVHTPSKDGKDKYTNIGDMIGV